MKNILLTLFLSVIAFARFCSAQPVDRYDSLELSSKINQVFDITKEARLANELEILGEQIEKLKALKSEYADLVKQNYKDVATKTKGMSREEANKVKTEMWKKIHLSTVRKIEKILLPHQVKRLNQIAVQRRLHLISRGDRFEMIIAMAKKLDLEKSEFESFKDSVNKEKERYEKSLLELIKKTDKAILRSLPPKARKQLTELHGEIY